ncbi:MAG TPA: hypothetical protein VJJ98_06870 [Sedimentisphaerales bacterium]|nr:hypothetical protein [Sedimentisphaerales bacterium]
MARKEAITLLIIVLLLVTASEALAGRAYEYVFTVCMPTDYPGYNPDVDYDSINEAIVAMNAVNNGNGPSGNALGCIYVWPNPEEPDGAYYEQLNDVTGGNDLPAHCDLEGKGSAIDDVKIKHRAEEIGERYDAGIDCAGDNIVSRIKIHNYQYGEDHVQANIEFKGSGELRDCMARNGHALSVKADGDFFMTGCTISSYFGACVEFGNRSITDSTFATVSDCVITPHWFNPFETPTGIEANGPGRIERVTIVSQCTNAYSTIDEYGVFGIVTKLKSGEHVEIIDCSIDLELTTQYLSGNTAALRVCGILSGNYWSFYTTQYPGLTTVRDCTINVSGVEGSADASDVMVEGILARDGANIHVYGCSSIITNWTEVGEGNGHEWLLGEEDEGAIGASFPGIKFEGTNEAEYYTQDGIDSLWGIGFRVEDASGDAMAVFDYCGNLLLNGTLTDEQTWPSVTMDDEFIVRDSTGNNVAVINAVDGDMFIHGVVKLDSNNEWADPDIGANEFIICDKDGKEVGYIDESGNIYLKGGVFEEFELIEW